MKVLNFKFRDQYYKVNEKGEIMANGLKSYSPTWKFLGGTKHHWSKHIDVGFGLALRYPEKLEGCLGWDLDHGTLRQWGGSYNGKLPRITNVYVTEE
jgi:hypothetical protein